MLVAAKAGAAEGTWLRAERQSAGRGRLGRAWMSPAGNLYASTLVRLRATDPQAATLALVAGVAVEEAVSVFIAAASAPEDFLRHPGPVPGSSARQATRSETSSASPAEPWTPEQVRGDGRNNGGVTLKWPNDLLLNGEKLSGILLERADHAVIIGIGANLAHHPDLPDRPATSLAAHGVDVTPAAFLDTLVETFARWLARWRGEGLAPIRTRWLERAHPVGTALTARLPDGSALNGLFDGLDGDGALILRLGGGERRVIHAADVFLL
ncbi:biotin--[acetyl-CoA-carboxylase] ligase [Sphingomonas sp.]|uniref:biotin--[acetyl-CoA-carboxylase] ligase n=1 Tax=Sphingomonas sp. TaxID=28214 RepID=UPI0035BC2E62